MLKLLPFVCRIQDGLANAVESIAKQALRGFLMRLERSRSDHLVPPSPHMPGPAKRERQHTACCLQTPSLSQWVSSRLNPRDPRLPHAGVGFERLEEHSICYLCL